MSGQAGIYYHDRRPVDRSLAERLGAGLSRHAPDGGGERFGDGLLMVYRALRAEPESYREQQPFVSRRNNWMTWDGRLDNRDDLILLVKDNLQDDTTDVAIAMAAYEKWGEQCFNRLIGDWSLALWNASRQSVVLASDYMGVRPLYYCARNDFLAWSSDLEILVSWMDCTDDFDRRYIASFLTGSTKYDRTIYRSISYVPCAHAILPGKDGVAKMPFWNSPVANRIRYRDVSDYEEHLLHLFREAVLTRLRTHDAVCCDLSGGLDSSSVTCMAHHLIQTGAASPKHLTTFSLMDPAMDDIRYIELVERHCNIEGIHMSLLPVWSVDSPRLPMPLRSMRTNELLEAEFRRQSIRVNITGKGGDLTMANVLYDADQLADYYRTAQWSRLFRLAYAWSRATGYPIWSVLKLGMTPLLPASTQQRLWREFSKTFGETYGHVDKISVLNRHFIEEFLQMDHSSFASEYRRASPSQRGFLYGIQYHQLNHTRIPRAHLSVKSTHPYFHRSLVEFVAGIPRQILCQPGQPRHLMRRAFGGLLPPAIRDRRTKALSIVVDDKSILDISAEVSQYSQLLTEAYGFVNGDRLRGFLRNPQAVNYSRDEIGNVLTLELWLRSRAKLTTRPIELADEPNVLDRLGTR